VEFNNNPFSANAQGSQAATDSAAMVQAIVRDIDVAPMGHWDELRGGVSKSSDVPHHLSVAKQTANAVWTEFLSHLGSGGIQSLPARHEAMMRQVRDLSLIHI
jgi:hypothetical protein